MGLINSICTIGYGPMILLSIFAIFIYFVPSIVANNVKNRNTPSIFIFNLFLGWTFAGWALALVWAFYRDRVAPAPMLRARLIKPSFHGLWSNLSGRLECPAMVEHEGVIYGPLHDLDDVTLSEPGRWNKDWVSFYENEAE